MRCTCRKRRSAIQPTIHRLVPSVWANRASHRSLRCNISKARSTSSFAPELNITPTPAKSDLPGDDRFPAVTKFWLELFHAGDIHVLDLPLDDRQSASVNLRNNSSSTIIPARNKPKPKLLPNNRHLRSFVRNGFSSRHHVGPSRCGNLNVAGKN